MIDFLLDVFKESATRCAIVWNNKEFTYSWLISEIANCRSILRNQNIISGEVVVVRSEFSPFAVAMMLALIENENIYIPMSTAVGDNFRDFLEVASAQHLFEISKEQTFAYSYLSGSGSNALYDRLRKTRRPGLILFSSGSTGKSKAAVHDFVALLEKFKIRKQKRVMLAFLLFDHIGGINTLLYALANGGTLVTLESRDPDMVGEAIQRYSVEVLPTSPTFCNLMIFKNVPERFNLNSLELITYGTEVMPENTLHRLNELLPHVKFQQTYGLSEIGILRSKSESNNSLWVKIGGEGFETRVIDGLLEVKATSAMLGYLNAPSPFTEDGWFKTGDAVEVKGEFFKILGRVSEIINVGGEKVYPAEVESLLLQLSGVEDVVVTGEKNPVTGNIVVAKVKLSTDETVSQFRVRLRQEFASKIESYKIPQKIIISKDELYGVRFKRSRKTEKSSERV